MPPSKSKPKKQTRGAKRKTATKKQIVDAIARKHHVPTWLLWGVFGAESTWGTDGNNYFGLIEPEYRMYDGTTRRPKNTADLVESADIAAELLYSLKQEHGSWAGAVAQYAPYSISHPEELSREGSDEAGETVDVSIWEQALGGSLLGPLGSALGGAGILGDAAKGGGEIVEKITGGLNPIGDIIGPIEDISAVFKTLGELLFTPEGWVRIGKLVGGAALFLWGLGILIQGSKVVSKGTAGAKKAIEVAALVK